MLSFFSGYCSLHVMSILGYLIFVLFVLFMLCCTRSIPSMINNLNKYKIAHILYISCHHIISSLEYRTQAYCNILTFMRLHLLDIGSLMLDI